MGGEVKAGSNYKSMELVQEYRHILEQNRKSRNRPYGIGSLGYDKSHLGERLSNKWCWPSHMENDKMIFFSLVIRINSKWTRNLNVKMKQVLEKIWVNFLMYYEWAYVSKSKGIRFVNLIT